MKPKIKFFSTDSGFTIIELLVVISIMGLFTTLVLVNYNQLRAERNKKIARHELATNIRKAQSYSLTGRLSGQGVPIRFYIVKLTVNSNQYEIQSINNTASSSTPPVTIETVRFPDATPLKELWLSASGVPDASTNCAQIAFSLPYSKVYIDTSCNFQSLINNPGALLAKQDTKLHIVFDGQAGVVLPQSKPEVQLNGVVGTVSETIYTPPAH